MSVVYLTKKEINGIKRLHDYILRNNEIVEDIFYQDCRVIFVLKLTSTVLLEPYIQDYIDDLLYGTYLTGVP
jgi:hypothetical protein